MISRCITSRDQKYNVIILAGGNGSRMGDQSNYIPKSLSKIGNARAIDHIIQRYENIAHKIIIGTGQHSDLLESYVLGGYSKLDIEFSRETELKNNAISTVYCMDHADSRYPTLITFCDVLMLGNVVIKPDTLYYVNSSTLGHTGTFRHGIITDNDGKVKTVLNHDKPAKIGVVGCFVLNDTVKLKKIAYNDFDSLKDLTDQLIVPYNTVNQLKSEPAECLYEIGTENDLQRVRELWQRI